MTIKNYTLIKEQPLPEYNGTAYIFSHDKTKARILYLSCPEDDNKVFSISFCTPPENDKGIPHILEHCVLNGSRKFPVKEPFVELLKGSLNTFVNAMTYNDKTVFPVASRNDKDFRNLMDVYLDAVLYPNLRKDPFIMKQEGWHYEMTDPEGPVTYKGVVYNEMKGAYSSPERNLYLELERTLYPDTVYSKESGGYPEAIPTLSYEEFAAFHERYYHPSNSYIFFYGNGNVEEHLTFLDQEYLKDFDYKDTGAVIGCQAPFAALKEREAFYPSADESGEKAYLAYSVVLPPLADPAEHYAMELVSEMLVDAQDAPIRKALQKAGIGKDIFGLCDNGIYQPNFGVVAKDASAEDKDRFVQIVREELSRAAKEGLDKKLMAGVLNSAEFRMREADYGTTPKGLIVALTCMDTWLYGGDPLALLSYNPIFETLRAGADKGYFEKFIEEKLLQNTHGVILTLKPNAGMAAEIQQKEEAELAAYRDSLSREEREALCRETAELQERQARPDTKEALATIPLLTLDDLEKKAEQLPLQTQEKDGIALHAFPTFTNGIVYDQLYFSMKQLPEADLPYAALLTSVLGDVGTQRYSYTELDNEINIYTGGLSVNTSVLENGDDFEALFTVGSRFLRSYTEEALALMEEVLCRSRLDDKKRLGEIISENRSRAEMAIQQDGHRVAMGRAAAHLSRAGAWQEKLSGLDFFLFLRELEAHWEERADEVSARLQQVLEKIVSRRGARILTIAEENEQAAVQERTMALLQHLPAEPAAVGTTEAEPIERCHEALLTSGKIQFVAKAGRYQGEYRGSMAVLGSILSLDYLWNRVRVQGGAYGCMQRITRNGMVGFVSYRDPGLEETLKAFDEAGAVMADFDCDEREMTKYIIGTVSGMSPVLTPALKGRTAFNRMMTGMTPEKLQKMWDEILAATPEKLREDARILTEAMQDGVICVEGARDRLHGNAMFDKEIEVI